MEAIKKADVADFAAKVKAQLEANAKSNNDLQINTLRLQGAASAIEYILNLDPVEGEEISDGDYDVNVDADDISEEDVEAVASYLEDPSHYSEVYADPVSGAP